jgi:hypothetical protein
MQKIDTGSTDNYRQYQALTAVHRFGEISLGGLVPAKLIVRDCLQ